MSDLSTETMIVLDIIENALLGQVAENDRDLPAMLEHFPDEPAFVKGLMSGCDLTCQLMLKVVRRLQGRE